MNAVGLEEITLTGRPVLISDIDDVVLKFIEPFLRFLESRSLLFLPRSFKLTGNIVDVETQQPIDQLAVREQLDAFYAAQMEWQSPFDHAVEALAEISRVADIVFLTAMSPAYFAQRRALLDRIGLHFPLVASLGPKGPMAAKILHNHNAPSAFIDDMAHNVMSVGEHVESCLLLHMPPDHEVYAAAPAASGAALRAKGWPDASAKIRKRFERLS